jgi:uncharacterized protein (DUF1697 family)
MRAPLAATVGRCVSVPPMAVYILLFRGVGGKTQLPTAPLRAALTELGYENVGTYINSGNAYLATSQPQAEVLRKVAAVCKERFGFDKDIYAVPLPEWRKLVENNPFPDAAQKTPNFVHAAVLAQKPATRDVELVRSFAEPGEQLEVIGKVAYLHTPFGFGKSKLAERFDKKIGVPNTARNWNSVLKLLALAEAAATGSKPTKVASGQGGRKSR